MGTYEDTLRASVDDPEAFWLDAAEAIDWYSAPTRALDRSNPPFYRWFPDGELNVCHNALDRHVDAGRGEQAALIYDSPVTGTQRSYTYSQLRDETAAFAGVLAGLRPGQVSRHPGRRGPWRLPGATGPGRYPSRWTAGSPRRPDAPSPAPASARRSGW